jgi:PAS domain S-box-containing protein
MELDPQQFAVRLVSAMPDAIVYADAEGVIRFWNSGATRIFGFAEAEAIGQSLDIIIPERLRARHWEGFRATMQTGRSRYGEGVCSRFLHSERMARRSRSSSRSCRSPAIPER